MQRFCLVITLLILLWATASTVCSNEVPKIIWGIWLDFKNKKDGDGSTDFFIRNIKNLHSDTSDYYTVNFIVRWEQLMEIIRGTWLEQLVMNDFIGGAHKSDAVRFFLLNKYGGVWIDASTFMTHSISSVVNRMNYENVGFGAVYVSIGEFAFWINEVCGQLYNDLSFDERIAFIRGKGTSNHRTPFATFDQGCWHQTGMTCRGPPVMTENYLLISEPEHSVTSQVFQDLRNFWEPILPMINSYNILCDNLNQIYYHLVKESFLPPTRYDVNASEKEINYFLKGEFGCGYLFNYLQIRSGIKIYLGCASKVKVVVPVGDIKTEMIDWRKTKYAWEKYCFQDKDENIDSCKDLILTEENSGHKVYLMSSNVARAAKWANTMEARKTHEDTFVSNVVERALASCDKWDRSANCARETLVDAGVSFIKFSSHTRSSPLIDKLESLFSNDLLTASTSEEYPITRSENGAAAPSLRSKLVGKLGEIVAF